MPGRAAAPNEAEGIYEKEPHPNATRRRCPMRSRRETTDPCWCAAGLYRAVKTGDY